MKAKHAEKLLIYQQLEFEIRERQPGHNLMIILVVTELLLAAGMRRVTNQFGRLAKYGSQFAAAILTNIF